MTEAATPCDDAEVMRLWRECGLPEYFLGNGGTNHKLVAFAERISGSVLVRSAPIPGQNWVPTKPGSGNRIVCVQHIEPDPETVSYRTRNGVHRRIPIAEWKAWI